MTQSPDRTIALTTLVVHDYDEALAFYVGKLGFSLIEDTPLPGADKRWLVVAPSANAASGLLLARADGAEQAACVGRQAGGRVGFFLHTDNFARDHTKFSEAGVRFREAPRQEPYGTVAVFEDLYGNLWDLLEPVGS